MPGLPRKVEKLWKKSAKPTGVPSRHANTTSAAGRGPKSAVPTSASLATTSCSRCSYTASSRMKARMRGKSLRVAGRIVISPDTVSARGLHALGDGPDARQQRVEELAVGASPGAPALEQVDLHQVHRINVGVAQRNRALHGRVGIEQRAAVLDGEHLLAGALELSADLAREAPQRLRHQRIVAARDLEIRPCQHGLDIVDEAAQEEPAV